MKRLIVTPDKCINCKNCELACAFGHYHDFDRQKARVTVVEIAQEVGCPILCLQCEDAACIKVCPVEALVRDEELGTVVHLAERCIRCMHCVSACPFGNIKLNITENEIIKCDLCGGEPICAVFCPSGALEYK